MIVLCPSCQTRYRHPAEAGNAGCTAHCTRCDEHFPMSEVKRTYVVLAGGTVPAAARQKPIGMDDPLLAERVKDSALHADNVADQAMTYRVASDGVAANFEDPAAASTDDTLSSEDALPDVSPPRRSALSEGLVALVPTGGCAGVAYYLAAQQHLDPVSVTALGGAVGLLLGWGCLLWIRRKD